MKIDLNPADVYAEVGQNIRTIITTLKGSVVMNREFGISATLIDSPMPAAKERLSAEILEAVEKWEPRAFIKSVDFISEEKDGVAYPTVDWELIDG